MLDLERMVEMCIVNIQNTQNGFSFETNPMVAAREFAVQRSVDDRFRMVNGHRILLFQEAVHSMSASINIACFPAPLSLSTQFPSQQNSKYQSNTLKMKNVFLLASLAQLCLSAAMSQSQADVVARADDRGHYTVSGLGDRKQAVLNEGGNALDIAIAMLET